MQVHLKMKICSLAAESKLIRKERNRKKWKAHPKVRESLHNHRVGVVRRESRVSLLAYGFLRGRTYRALEPEGSKPVDWRRVAQLVGKYGNRAKEDATREVEAWRKAG